VEVEMARVFGPDFVALQVRDLESSARFYEERLGLQRAPQVSPDAVVFETGTVPFAVRRPLVDLDAVERLGWGVALWMGCDDAQALYESLKEANVRIAREPFDGPFGRTFAFLDPDGYAVTVHDA
jgi:predicted enzyme related to lactoylglutathione lyase